MAFDFNRTLDDRYLIGPAPVGLYQAFLKRALDIALVLLAAGPVLVVLIVLGLLIALDGKSPLYSQMRIGRGGREFRMWKLRSMVHNADALLETYLARNPVARLEWDRRQKLENDPRITRLGRFIRKTSLDELPQLWNVLRGEMSIIGPRPMMSIQRPLYPGTAYYEMRPGLSGYWQTSIRNETSFAERAFYDTSYFRDLSLQTDIRLIFRTFSVIVKGTGC
jgi:lipopolysaccharide/colanic/teichoic acid biosynthesis glycosyltransferase